MIKVLFFFLSTAFAQEATLSVNGQQVALTNVTQVGNTITAARLVETRSLKIGRNSFQVVPKGTRLSFYENTIDLNLVLRGLIITEKIPSQIYTLANNETVDINCGRVRSSVAFVSFSASGELLSGCRAASDQGVLAPGQSEKMTVLKDSQVYFFENGLMQAASNVSGRVIISDNSIPLHPKASIGFHENQSIHFFHPAEGASFTSETVISKNTNFFQPEGETVYAVFFHPNQKISSATLYIESDFDFSFEAFGSQLRTKLKTGPAGFDEDGNINKIVLSERAQITAEQPTYVRRTEQSTGAIVRGLYPVGAMVNLAKNSQLFLDTQGDRPVLQSYPEFGQHGLAFLHELSYEPL